MKTIIAGSRNITDYLILQSFIKEYNIIITEVISGGARGVDKLGERWANENNIPIKRFIPDWDKFGKKAGMLRNTDMAIYGEQLVTLWDGKSNGTKNMIGTAKNKGLIVHIKRISL